MRRWWLVLQSLMLAVLVTWPAARDLGSAPVGAVEGDIYKHLWTLWWMRHELSDGAPGLRTNLAAFPDGMDLWPIEPLNAPLAWLLPLPPVALANVLALIHVFLLGLCAGWLGRLVSRSREGGYVAGALAQCAAFTSFTLQVGVGELRQFWLVPLGLALLVRARDTGRWRWFLALGGTLGAATLACFYHGFFLAFATAVYALLTLRARLVLRYALAAALALGMVVTPVRTFTEGFNPDAGPKGVTFDQWMGDAGKAPLDIFPFASISPDELLTPRPLARPHADDHERAYRGGRYLGLGVLLLALAGLVAEPRRALPWFGVAAAGVVVSLGTVLWWQGKVLEIDGSRVVLPLAWVNRAMAYYIDPINFPARFIALPTVALAVAAALATRWRWATLLAPLAAADLLWGSVVPWPRDLAPLPDASGLVGAPGTGGVADITPFAELPGQRGRGEVTFLLDLKGPAARRRAIAAQIALDRPFDSIPIERMDRWAPDGFLWVQGLPLARSLAEGAWVASAQDWRESLWLLRDRGFDGLLLTHSNHGAHPEVVRFLTGVAGSARSSQAATYWEVPVVEASAEEAEAWRAAQAERVGRLPRPKMGPPQRTQ